MVVAVDMKNTEVTIVPHKDEAADVGVAGMTVAVVDIVVDIMLITNEEITGIMMVHLKVVIIPIEVLSLERVVRPMVLAMLVP